MWKFIEDPSQIKTLQPGDVVMLSDQSLVDLLPEDVFVIILKEGDLYE